MEVDASSVGGGDDAAGDGEGAGVPVESTPGGFERRGGEGAGLEREVAGRPYSGDAGSGAGSSLDGESSPSAGGSEGSPDDDIGGRDSAGIEQVIGGSAGDGDVGDGEVPADGGNAGARLEDLAIAAEGEATSEREVGEVLREFAGAIEQEGGERGSRDVEIDGLERGGSDQDGVTGERGSDG